MKKCTAQLLVTFALILGLTGIAAPAHADNPSPERAVAKFWDRVQFGHGPKAVLSIKKSCRTPKVRRSIIKMSNELWDLLKDTPFYIGIGAYKEKVNGRDAKVSYWLTLTDLDYYEEALMTIRNQQWVRIDGRWFINCRSKSASRLGSATVGRAAAGLIARPSA